MEPNLTCTNLGSLRRTNLTCIGTLQEAQEAPVPRGQVLALAACLEAAEIAILALSHEERYK